MLRSRRKAETVSYGVRLTSEEWAWIDAAPGETRSDRLRYRMREGATVDLAATRVGEFFAVPFARFEQKLDKMLEASPEAVVQTIATQLASLIQRQDQPASGPVSGGANPAQMVEFRGLVADLMERAVLSRAAKGDVPSVKASVAQLRSPEVPPIPALASAFAALTEAIILPQAGSDFSPIGIVVSRLKTHTKSKP